jgi:hypothetical protein
MAEHVVELDSLERELGIAVRADCITCGWHSEIFESAAEVLESDASARDSELRALGWAKLEARQHAPWVRFEAVA